jgi:hypothetical protein
VFALISLDDEDLIARKIREPSKPSILRPEERIIYKILPGEFFDSTLDLMVQKHEAVSL